MNVNNFNITFSNFNSVRDVKPKEVTETIEAFTKRFKKPTVLPHTISKYLKYSKKEQGEAKDGHCFSLATYNFNVEGSIRLDANVSLVHGIGLDIDNKNENQLSFEEFESKFKEYYYIFHTSHSHTKKQPRYRAILLFDQPITPERYKDVFEFFCNKLDQKVDPATKNPSRVFYYPSCPVDQEEEFFCTVNKGKLFDTSIVPVGTQSVTHKKSKKQSTAHSIPTFEKVDLDTLKIDAKLKASIIEGDKERQFISDSEHAASCIAKLLRKKISVTTIFCIVADSEYGINKHYVSEEQILADIHRIKKFIKEQNEKFIYGVKIGTEPHYPEPDYQDPDDICKDMYADIKSYAKHQHCTKTLCIKASAGVGKTKVVIRNIRRMVREDAYIEVYVPTNALAEEFKDRINKSKKYEPIAVEVIYGRSSEHAPEDHCIKKSITDSLSQASFGITSVLCRNHDNTEFCVAYNTCNYRKQFQRKCSVRIYTHHYLFIKRNSDERTKKPDLVIIDESFYKASLSSTKIKVSEIENLSVDDCIKKALNKNLPYEYLHKNHDDPQHLIDCELQRLKEKQEKLIAGITPNTLQSKVYDITERANNFTKDIKLLETMQADYDRIEFGGTPIFLYSFESTKNSTSEKVRDSWYCVEKHKELVRLYWQEEDETISLLPTVCIDADLNPLIANIFFEEISYKEYFAKRQAKIWQEITTSNGISKFTKDNEEKKLINSIKRSIERFCILFQDQRVLLVTYKELLEKELAKLPENCDPIYFGNLRGIDKYKNHTACIIIGRYQIPFDAIDCDGIGLWYDSNDLKLKEIVRTVRGFRIKNGKKLGVPVSMPKDYRLQALAEQSRECETLQAIDRLRLIHHNKKKVVLILSNLPLNVDIDQYGLKNSALNVINKIVRKAENNVITLHSKTLYKEYKSRFTSKSNKEKDTSKSNAKKIIERWKKMFVNDDNIATIYGVNFKVTRYSFNKNGGKPSWCLHRIKTPKQVIIESLEKIHGKTIKLYS